MKRTPWKKLLCLTLVLTMLLSLSAVMAAPYDKNNPENCYDQTENKYVPVIETDLSYDTYTCLGDSIAAGFGDYDYYTADGSQVDIYDVDYSKVTLDALKWASFDNYTLYYDDTIQGFTYPIGSYYFYTNYDFMGNVVKGFTKFVSRGTAEDGSTLYLDADGNPVEIKEGYVPYTRSESVDANENDFTYMGMRAVDKAYHSIVAKSVGAETLYPLGYSGTRTTEVRSVLDPEYEGDQYLFSYGLVNNYTKNEDGSIDYYTASAPADWNHRSYDFIREKYLNAIDRADLISVNLGSNDIMTIPVINCMGKLYGTDDAALVALVKKMLGQTYPEMLETLFSTANTLNNVQQTLTTLLSLMIDGYRLYFQNIMPILDTIHERNPEADIAVVGLYNPMQKVKLTDDSLIAIGEVGTLLITGINAYLKANAEKHHYTYVDVTGTETQDTYSMSVGMSTFFSRIMTDVHPCYEGHEYMASQILSSVEKTRKDAELDLPYVDVDSETAYAQDIRYCYDNGLICGTSAHTFAPGMNATRSMFIASMYALGSGKAGMDTDKSFTKVMKSSYYSRALAWAYSKGITFGANISIFSPLTKVTREQMALMLYRYAGSPAISDEDTAGADLSAAYTDMNRVSRSARDAVLWAAVNGILNTGDGKISPKYYVTRGEMAHALAVVDGMDA